jgi:integrative and conjugative element protein (TIGR02256 family)
MTRLIIDSELTKAVTAHCKRWAPKETGGILLGYRCDSAVHVTGFVGPGPRAKHTRASFIRDGEFAQRMLDEVVTGTGGRSDYLGEWHSHPAPVEPSGRDEKSIRWVAANAGYDCADPVLLVVTLAGRAWSLRAFTSKGTTLSRCAAIEACDTCGLSDQLGITVKPDDT